MEFPNNNMVLTEADEVLVAAGQIPRRLVWLYAGVMAGINVALLLANWLLAQMMGDTGGLGGMDQRFLLETVLTMLQLAGMVFLMFWEMGYVHAANCWAARKWTDSGDLLAGLRNFGPVLRGMILRTVVVMAVMIVAMQLSSAIYLMTPFSEGSMELLLQLSKDPAYVPDAQSVWSFLLSYSPFMLITLAALLLPVLYRLRLMDLALMDQPKKGAFYALRMSLVLMRGNCIKLLKLDLRFWGFYALELLTTVVCYLDMMLVLLGMDFGSYAQLASVAAAALGLACQVLLYVALRNRIMTAYAVVYSSLKPPPAPAPEQKQNPWAQM